MSTPENSPFHLDDNVLVNERESESGYWKPLEQKSYPHYIQERFETINSIHSLDCDKIVKILSETEDSALFAPILDYLCYRLHEVAATESKWDINDTLLPTLDTIALDTERNWDVRGAAVYAMGYTGEVALPYLDTLSRHPDKSMRELASVAMGYVGPQAIPYLDKLIESDDFYITELAKLMKETILDSTNIQNINIPLEVKNIIEAQEPALLSSTEDSFGRLEREKEQIILDLNDIVSELKVDYPEIVGLTIVGSLSKGYWSGESDLDWAFIFKSETQPLEDGTKLEIKKKFGEKFIQKIKSKMPSLGLCSGVDHSLDASHISDDVSEEELEIAFNGIFIGDREKLKGIQNKIVNSISRKKWESIRGVWRACLKGYTEKMEGRFGLSHEEALLVISLRELLWSPPDFETAKKVY